jgi:uncharacterized protein involved in cysteine biosynthesis
MKDFKRGFSAAVRGLRLAFGNADVRRSYAKIVLSLLTITLTLDAGGIWGLWWATGWDDTTSGWLVAAFIVARVIGIVGILLVAPLLAIFTMNIVMPLFNEGPFLAGVRAIDPERAQQLMDGPNLSIPHQIKISILRLLLFLFLSLLAFVVSFIPVVGQVAGPAMGTYFTARALGWELLDPYFAFTNTSYQSQVEFLGRHHTSVVGFGFPFALLFAIPIVGPLVFVMAQASAATLVCEVLEPDEAAGDGPAAVREPAPGSLPGVREP